MPIAFHTMHALVDRRVIFPSSDQRVGGYRRALAVGARFGLGWFHLGSDHIHAVVFCAKEEVAWWAHDVECAWTLGAGLPVGFGRYHAKPVVDQGHLETLLGYVLRQESHHGVALDPFHLGSNGPDLCGGRLRARKARDEHARELVRRMVPRWGPARIDRLLLGGPRQRLSDLGAAPAGLVGVRLEERLLLAGKSALGRTTVLKGGPPARAARQALVQLCRETALGDTVNLPRMLGCSASAVGRLSRSPVDPNVLAVVRWQVEFCLTRTVLMAESAARTQGASVAPR